MKTIAIQHRLRDGYHVLTSREVDGLYVASKDAAKAHAGVAPAIEQLLAANEGVVCRVEPVSGIEDLRHESTTLWWRVT